MLTAEQIQDQKTQIIDILRNTGRAEIESLITFLSDSDFFTAPASTKYHGAYDGGLAEHSLHVWYVLTEKNRYYSLGLSEEAIAITALCHDLCKVGFYQEGGEPCSKAQYDYLSSLWTQKSGSIKEKPETLLKYLEDGQFKRSVPAAIATILIDWLKNKLGEPFPEIPVVYSVKDSFPVGHGEKSVITLLRFIQLTDQEIAMIRWHMGGYIAKDDYRDLSNAMELYPAIVALHAADLEASHLIKIGGNEA